jgi:hypothetical protein
MAIFRLKYLVAFEDDYPCVMTPLYIKSDESDSNMDVGLFVADANTSYTITAFRCVSSCEKIMTEEKFRPIIIIHDGSYFSQIASSVGDDLLYAFAFSELDSDIYVGDISSIKKHFKKLSMYDHSKLLTLEKLDFHKRYEIFELIQDVDELSKSYSYIVSHENEFNRFDILYAKRKLREKNDSDNNEDEQNKKRRDDAVKDFNEIQPDIEKSLNNNKEPHTLLSIYRLISELIRNIPIGDEHYVIIKKQIDVVERQLLQSNNLFRLSRDESAEFTIIK